MALRDRLDPIKIMCVIFALIFGSMVLWLFAQEAGAEYRGTDENPKVTKKKVFDYKGYHPRPGTVGDRPSFDLGTVAVTNRMPMTLRVCMTNEDLKEFSACSIIVTGSTKFFYGITSGRHLVAWSALSHTSMYSGARYVIIKSDDLYYQWFNRKMITKDKTNEQLVGANVPFYGIRIDDPSFGHKGASEGRGRSDRT